MELYEQNATNVIASKVQSRKWKFVATRSISSRVWVPCHVLCVTVRAIQTLSANKLITDYT